MTRIHLHETALATALVKLARRSSRSGLSAVDQYLWLQSRLHERNIASDPEYQRRFNGYYRVRRNAGWRHQFYGLLEQEKHRTPSLQSVLRTIYENTDQIEGSFASKLVATVVPSEPVIDSVVLDNLKLALPRSGHSDARINGIVRIHEQIKQAFTDFLQSEGGPELTARFSAQFPQASVTEMKMLDLVLWQTR